jgi:hypothetical protein
MAIPEQKKARKSKDSQANNHMRKRAVGGGIEPPRGG